MAVAARKVLQKRVPTSIEYRFKITNYGSDNLYPQTVEQISFRSGTVESALDCLEDFTAGQGFQQNGDLVINRFGQTLNDILSHIAKDYSPFNGWGLHFNVNQLGMIVEILPLKFINCRFGLPDEYGHHYDIKYFLHWDAEQTGRVIRFDQIRTYPLWNKRDINPALDYSDIGNFEGFAHYWTPEMDSYPKATFDSVLDSAQTDGEIQVFELGSIQNSFLGTSIFKHPGKFASDKEKNRIVNELSELTGAENAGAVFVVEVPQNFEGEIIENLPANNNDSLFKTTNENVVNRIVTRFGVPYSLLGIQSTTGGIFTNEQMADSYNYYNLRTRKRRNIITQEFNSFMQFWAGGVIEVGGIIESEFGATENATDTN